MVIEPSFLVCCGSAFTLWFAYCCLKMDVVLPSLQIPWGFMFLTALLATTLPLILLLEATKRISATKASLLSVFEPLSTMILGVLLLGEHITNVQIVGAVVVLMGALLTHYDR